jgi:hypothetical protein
MWNIEIDMEEGAVQKHNGRYWGEIINIKTAMGQMQFLHSYKSWLLFSV